MADGPVAGNECWFRVVTNEDHITRDRTLHYQALKGKQFCPSLGKKWSHELSGRIVSLAGDKASIERQARSFIQDVRNRYQANNPGKKVPDKFIFAGVACRRVADLRSPSLRRLTSDVVYTPEPADCAHSDIVLYGAKQDADVNPIRDWLRGALRVITPSQLNLLVSSCGEAVLPVRRSP